MRDIEKIKLNEGEKADGSNEGLEGQMVVCAEASECEFHKEHTCLAAQPHISDPRCGTCGYKPEANCIKVEAA